MLEIYSLNEPLPHYEALSYCWGDLGGTIPINVDCGLQYMTANLPGLLRRRRSPTVFVVLWVDALCINQDDTKEKGYQLELMRTIYQCANVLTIWRGEEADDSNVAMNLIRDLGALGKQKDNVRFMSEAETSSINYLLQRSWWYRTWIVQELVNGGHNDNMTTKAVMCGWAALPWIYFARAAHRLHYHNEKYRQHFQHLDSVLGLDKTLSNLFPSAPASYPSLLD